MTQPFQTVPLALRRWLQENNIPADGTRVFIEFTDEDARVKAERALDKDPLFALCGVFGRELLHPRPSVAIIGGVVVKFTHRGENHG